MCVLWIESRIHLSEPILSNKLFQRTDSVILLRHHAIPAFQNPYVYVIFKMYQLIAAMIHHIQHEDIIYIALNKSSHLS